MKTEEDFLLQCGSLLKWMGFTEVSPREFRFSHQQLQRIIINGMSRDVPGEKLQILVKFSAGSFEIVNEEEIPMENVDITIGDTTHGFIMYYDDYKWFEQIIKRNL